MESRKRYSAVQLLRLKREQADQIRTDAYRLGMSAAELARLALRFGLPIVSRKLREPRATATREEQKL
jgi:hypothetical protein